jgi:membrane protein
VQPALTAEQTVSKHLLWPTFKRAAVKWNEDNALRLGAALSYYAAFSIGPLLMLSVGIASMVFGNEASQGELARQMQGLIGPDGAKAIEALIAGAKRQDQGVLATIIGIVALFFAASGVFAELQSALNKIWNVDQKKIPGGIKGMIHTRLLSFAMVLVMGFLMLVSLVLSTILGLVGKFFSGLLPLPAAVFEALNALFSIVIIATLFTMIFKVLPDAKVRWRDAWPGALLTSILFTVGKFLIGLYLGKSAIASSFGASASLALILLWTFYSSLILFYGAEFTQVYSSLRERLRGRGAPLSPVNPPIRGGAYSSQTA